MNLFLIFLILIVLVALFLILIIMVQNPKGGGLDSTFGGGGIMMGGGVKQTTDFLEKATWTLFGLLIGLILLSNTVIFTGKSKKENVVTPDQIETPAKKVPAEAPAAAQPQKTDNTQQPASANPSTGKKQGK